MYFLNNWRLYKTDYAGVHWTLRIWYIYIISSTIVISF